MSLWQIAQPARIQACLVLPRIHSLPDITLHLDELLDLHLQFDCGSDAAA
jgi:hypothetical protein